jgi:hypothetical protein
MRAMKYFKPDDWQSVDVVWWYFRGSALGDHSTTWSVLARYTEGGAKTNF